MPGIYLSDAFSLALAIFSWLIAACVYADATANRLENPVGNPQGIQGLLRHLSTPLNWGLFCYALPIVGFTVYIFLRARLIKCAKQNTVRINVYKRVCVTIIFVIAGLPYLLIYHK